MGLVVNEGSGADFKPCPEGLQRLVCCDVINHGVQKDRFGESRKVTIVWQSEHHIDDPEHPEIHGLPYIVQRRFTASLNEKADLRKVLESWRGRKFTKEELAHFDLDPDPPAKPTLIGANAYAQIFHEKKPRGTFAELATIMPLPKGMERLTLDPKYVRRKDRPGAAAPAAAKDDPDIPF